MTACARQVDIRVTVSDQIDCSCSRGTVDVDRDLPETDLYDVPASACDAEGQWRRLNAVDYYIDPIPKPRLLELLKKMRIAPRQLLRTKETIYKTLKLGDRDLSDDVIVDLMVKHPDLIQRPIVENGPRAILARPAERLKEIL